MKKIKYIWFLFPCFLLAFQLIDIHYLSEEIRPVARAIFYSLYLIFAVIYLVLYYRQKKQCTKE